MTTPRRLKLCDLADALAAAEAARDRAEATIRDVINEAAEYRAKLNRAAAEYASEVRAVGRARTHRTRARRYARAKAAHALMLALSASTPRKRP